MPEVSSPKSATKLHEPILSNEKIEPKKKMLKASLLTVESTHALLSYRQRKDVDRSFLQMGIKEK